MEFVAALFMACVVCARGLQLPTILDDRMVLSRDGAQVWGTAEPGESVVIYLDEEQVASVAADKSGNFLATLPPQAASFDHSVRFATDIDNRTLGDVAFGDVFLCSGQSNMEMSVNGALNPEAEIADSANFPGVRFYTVELTESYEPLTDTISKPRSYTWGSGPDAFAPATSGARFSWPSASCYFFGRELSKKLGPSIPIGLVVSCWGGQTAEAFSSPDALADETCGGILSVSAEEEAGESRRPAPTTLWFGMIHPLLNMVFTGATWYQGESNSDDPASYACRFPAMISDWRAKFNQELPFVYVELAAYQTDYSVIREAQGYALKLPNTGVATAIDLGDAYSPDGAIHPRRKQEVGRRLALSMAEMHYGIVDDDILAGPMLSSVKFDSAESVVLTYERAANLHVAPTPDFLTQDCSQSPFEVSADGFNFARASNYTILPSPAADGVGFVEIFVSEELLGGAEVTAVRLGFEGYPQCALYS